MIQNSESLNLGLSHESVKCMKIPSLFRIPDYKRFNFEPRYYDPVKEDIENRTARIKFDLSEKSLSTYRRSIHETFQKRDRQTKRANLMQLILIIIMMSTIAAWLYFGNVAVYVFLVVFPLDVWVRTKNYFQP